MLHLPIFADVTNRACLVVGGGTVAERRVRQLRAAGARVTVLAPSLSPALAGLVASREIAHERGRFADHSLDAYWLVVAATDERATNAAVARAAEAAKRLCNAVDDPEHCTFIMPAVIDREPITVAISSSAHSPVVTRWLKGIIESLVPARVGALARLAERWRGRARDAIPDADERRRFWQETLTGQVADHAFAGRAAESEQALEAALADWRSNVPAERARVGEAYLVGAGPGGADLITIRGRQLLATADAVLYDNLVNPEILSFARRDAEIICVGKSARRPSITQAQLNRLLVQLVSSGKRVCRLKGGDPLIFGRAGEELEALVEAGLPFQIVPGVSAVEGCAAYAGIPLTVRGVSQAVLITTGHTHDHLSADLTTYRPGQTLALYMGVAHFGAVAEQLIANGHDPDTPVAVIERGTYDDQRIVRTTLENLASASAAERIVSPALLLVGATVRFAERYAWFRPGKLKVTPAADSPRADQNRKLV